jgi:hypothetical protein
MTAPIESAQRDSANGADLGFTVPGWSLRVLFAAIALTLALAGVPDGPWPAIAALLTGISIAVPRWLTAWLLIGVLAFSVLLEPGTLSPRVLALIAGVHALHIVASWMLVVPAGARLQPAVLLRSLRRYVLIQVPVQAVAVVVLATSHGAVPALAAVSGLAMIAIVAVFVPPLLRRPPG